MLYTSITRLKNIQEASKGSALFMNIAPVTWKWIRFQIVNAASSLFNKKFRGLLIWSGSSPAWMVLDCTLIWYIYLPPGLQGFMERPSCKFP